MARKLPTKYLLAIAWIAANDDTSFMDDEPVEHVSVTLSMAADLWNIPQDEAVKHLRYALDQAAGVVPNTDGPSGGA